jgi:hypothetical protein
MSVSFSSHIGGGPATYAILDPAYQAGVMAAAFNDQSWTPQSFFDPPRVQAREIVEFGVGKTYDFFA